MDPLHLARGAIAHYDQRPPQDMAVRQAELRAPMRLARRENSCLIDPRRSKFLQYWDILIAVALIYTSLVAPFEVGFLPAATEVSGLFVINRVVDVLFFIDMGKEFFVMYEPENANGLELGGAFGAALKSTSGVIGATPPPAPPAAETQTTRRRGARGGVMVKDRRKIALHYMSGWFLIDFLSVATLTFDVLPLVFATDDMESINSLKILKILRALRLIKCGHLGGAQPPLDLPLCALQLRLPPRVAQVGAPAEVVQNIPRVDDLCEHGLLDADRH